mmetsp:Transcript_22497/g.69234  ORF Transcript_22497/g.69234 Transcript_22497/m.69234 type:complete len:281 (-) Transcript_22497:56-898(-)
MELGADQFVVGPVSSLASGAAVHGTNASSLAGGAELHRVVDLIANEATVVGSATFGDAEALRAAMPSSPLVVVEADSDLTRERVRVVGRRGVRCHRHLGFASSMRVVQFLQVARLVVVVAERARAPSDDGDAVDVGEVRLRDEAESMHRHRVLSHDFHAICVNLLAVAIGRVEGVEIRVPVSETDDNRQRPRGNLHAPTAELRVVGVWVETEHVEPRDHGLRPSHRPAQDFRVVDVPAGRPPRLARGQHLLHVHRRIRDLLRAGDGLFHTPTHDGIVQRS